MKKSIRKIVSVLTAACLCISMVPAQALAAVQPDDEFVESAGSNPAAGGSNSYGEGNGDFSSTPVQSHYNEASATSRIFGVLEAENFQFTSQSANMNFASPEEAANNTQPGADPGPLYAVFGGDEGTYNYTWTLEDVTIKADGTYEYSPHATTPSFKGLDGNTYQFGQEASATFGDPDNGVKFEYSINPSDYDGLQPDSIYRYTLTIKDTAGTAANDVITAEIFVSTFANYEKLKIFLDGNLDSGTSVEGFLYKNVGLNPADWTMPTLRSQAIPETSPVYATMAGAAASSSPVQNITQPTQLVLTDLENKPDDEPAYKLDLTVHLGIPADYPDPGALEPGSTVTVYRYDQDTGTVETYEGTVVQQTDRNGNVITGPDGQPVLSIEFTIRGTSSALGSFAVGYDNPEGSFTVEASASDGGSIAPNDTMTFPVGSSPQFVMNAQAGYQLMGVSLQCDGQAVSVQAGTLVGNVFTLDAAKYNMEDGETWAVHALFEEPVLTADAFSVSAHLRYSGSSDASQAYMDLLSGAAGAQKYRIYVNDDLPAAGEDALMMPAKDGVYLEFSGNYRVKSLKINNEEFSVAGTSYFISVLTENVNIEVVYEDGLPEPTILRTITTTVVGGNGSVMDENGEPQTTDSLTVNYGGTGTVTLLPAPGYMVDTAMLKTAGSTDEGIDVSDQVTQSNGKANIQIRNVLEDMELTVTFKQSSGSITISVDGDGGSVDPAGTIQLEANKAQQVRIIPSSDGAGYEVGQVKVNGTPINIANYLTPRNGGAYYTFNIVMNDDDHPLSDFERNPDGTVDKVLGIERADSTITVIFNAKTPPAPDYVSVITSVASGGGSITPTQRVAAGSDVDVYVFPDEGMRVKDVTLNGVSVKGTMTEDGSHLTLLNVQTDQEVIVTFDEGDSPLWPSKKPRYTLHPSAGTGGSVTPATDVLVYAGQSQTFSFLAATGYQWSELKVDGKTVDPDALGPNEELTSSTYTMKDIQADHNLIFTFMKPPTTGEERGTFNVQINVGEHGIASPDGPVDVARGSDLPITILPDANHCVDKIWVRSQSDTSADGGANFIGDLQNGVFALTDVQDDMVVDITFREGTDPNQPSTDVNNLIRLGSKNVSLDPGLLLSPEVSGMVFYKEEGTDHANIDQTFTVQVAAGYALGTVKVNGNVLAVTEVADGVYEFTVPKDQITTQMQLEVTSTQVPPSTQVVDLRTITVTKEGNGTVSPYGIINGIVRVETGESQTFYFIPDTDYKVESVQVDGSNVNWDATTYSYTIPAVTQDMRIHVVFSPEPGAMRPATHTVSVTADPDPDDGQVHGFVSVDNAEVVSPGALTISFKPDSGYETHVYRLSGGTRTEVTDQLRGGTLYLTDITEDRAYAVAFTPLTQAVSYQTVTASSGSNGRISPEGTITVVTGSNLTFTFLGDDGYTVDKVWVTRNGQSEEVSQQIDEHTLTYTIQNITGKVEIWASFKVGSPSGSDMNPCVITATAGVGGIVSPARVEAAPGTQVTFTFMPLRGYQLLSVLNGSQTVPLENVKDGSYTFTVTTNTTVHAEFQVSADTNPEGNKHDVTLSVANGADGLPHGEISPSGVVSVPHGGSVPFTMIPEDGYKVGSIVRTIGGVDYTVQNFSGFKYTEFSVEADTDITVTFEKLAPGETVDVPTFFEVVATASINGAISPSGTVKVAEGGMAMFSFQPNDGYRLSYLVVDGANVAATDVVRGQYSFIGVKENHTIHAVFCGVDEEPADFVTVNAGRPSGGSISPAGAQLVMKGSSPQYTISAFYGYTLSDILVNDQSIFADGPDGTKNVAPVNNANVSWANSTLTLKNVQADTGIVALFRKSSTTPDDQPVEYSRITVNANGPGSVSYNNGTTIIEALKTGQTLDVSIIPEAGYAIGSLSVRAANGEDLDLTDASDASVAQQLKDIWRKGYITLTAAQVNYDVTINVTFRKQTADEQKEVENGSFIPAKSRTISAMAFGRGSINPHGSVVVAQNASITFSMVPMEGYELSALRIDDKDALGMLKDGRTYTFTPGTKDQKIEATFSLLESPDQGVTYLVRTVIDAPDGAAGHASIDQMEVKAGASASLYFWPETGSKLTGLTVSMQNGDTVDETSFSYDMPEYTLSNITGNTTVTAHFELLGPDEPPSWTITEAYAQGSVLDGGGRISPTSATVPQGCQQVFNFFPDEGYEVSFLRVNDDIVYVDASIRSYPLIVESTDPDNPSTLQVAFKYASADVSDVTVTAKVEATVEFGSTGGTAEVWPISRTIPSGTPATFYVKPEYGYTIKDVKVDGTQVAFEGVGETSDDNFHMSGIDWSQGKTLGVSGERRAADQGGAYAGGASTAPALYTGNAGLFAAADRDPQAFYEVYRITVPNVTHDITANVSLVKISDLSPDGPYWYVPCNTHNLTVTSDGVGLVSPLGTGFLPEGQTENIRISAYKNYYLESVICTYADGTTEDITQKVTGSNLQVTMGSQDMTIHVTFKPVGEASFVHFELGSALDPFSNDLVASGEVTTDPQLVIDGVPVDFVRDVNGNGEGLLIGFLTDKLGPEGRPLVLDKVYLNGQQIPLTIPDSQWTRIPTTSGGRIDVVFREIEEGHEVVTPDTFTVVAEVTSGEGTVSPSTPLSVNAGGEATIGWQAAEGWMLDTENCFDWYVEDGAEEATAHKISAEDMGEGSYVIRGVDRDHRVTIAFVKYVDVEMGWTNGDNGYVTPNTMNGEPMKIEAGTSIAFIVAPYEGYNVESVVETVGGSESNVTDRLRTSDATTQQLLGMPGHENFTVKHTEPGMGVTRQAPDEDVQPQSLQPLVQDEKQDNAVLYEDAPEETSSAAPALMNFNFAYGAQTSPITDDTTVMATWTDENNVVDPDPEKDLRTITVEIIGTGGTVDPMVGTGYDGEYITFNFIPDDGYAVAYFEESRGGKVERYTSELVAGKKEYTYGPIDGDGYIKVGFVSITDPGGSNDALNRYLRTLQSLAQTGDLTAPLLTMLLGIAGLALVMAFITYRRRRKHVHGRHS